MAVVGIAHDGDTSRLEDEAPDVMVTSLREVVDWVKGQ
jgi:hypothetical protein